MSKHHRTPEGYARQQAWLKEYGKNPKRKADRLATAYRTRYGNTLSDKEKLLVAQEYKCANTCCRRSLNMTRACWDHDHKTGQLRGILCTQCNVALGMCKDSAEVLAGLINYLQSYRSGPPAPVLA